LLRYLKRNKHIALRIDKLKVLMLLAYIIYLKMWKLFKSQAYNVIIIIMHLSDMLYPNSLRKNCKIFPRKTFKAINFSVLYNWRQTVSSTSFGSAHESGIHSKLISDRFYFCFYEIKTIWAPVSWFFLHQTTINLKVYHL
jgi:hypothetical protein